MIFRVHLYDDADGSQGYEFYATAREADKMLREWTAVRPETRHAADIEAAEVPVTKVALVKLLDRWAGHADNG